MSCLSFYIEHKYRMLDICYTVEVLKIYILVRLNMNDIEGKMIYENTTTQNQRKFRT